MKAFINHHLTNQTGLDSGKLTMLGAVFHNFSEPGEYLGTVLRGEQSVANFQLAVNEASPTMQVDIDLTKLKQTIPEHCECKSSDSEPQLPRFEVNPRGYAAFYVSRGPGGFTVRVGRLEDNSEKVFFDSSELKKDDLLAVTLIRPGTYSVTNVNTGAQGKIVVAYPKVGKTPYRPPDPVTIICTKNALEPDLITIEAARGQVYRFEVPSRINIELVEPDDGPKGPCLPRIRELKKR